MRMLDGLDNAGRPGCARLSTHAERYVEVTCNASSRFAPLTWRDTGKVVVRFDRIIVGKSAWRQMTIICRAAQAAFVICSSYFG